MIAWFARNHVAANLLMLAIIVLGLVSLISRIPLEVFPSVEANSISVSMSLPGAAPDEVEEGVTVKIEEAVQDLEGIEQIYSRAFENATTISLEVNDRYDARTLLADVKNRVDAINTFPAGAEKPIISLVQRSHDVITAVVSGDQSELEIRQMAEQVRDELLARDGISVIELDGVRNYEISIEVSRQSLQRYQLTLSEVASAIENSSRNVTAGSLKLDGGEILLRSEGQAYHKEDFENIVLRGRQDGGVIRLADVAKVKDGFEETPVKSRFNGRRAAFIDVYRVGSQSAIEVADKVKAYIDGKQSALPQGMEMGYWRDRSLIVKKRLKTLSDNALQGGILVLLLLTLFLRPSIAFWVFAGIPVSFMGAFLIMPVFDVSLNIISLFGFILVLGIVVDDAIVTGESVYTHLQRSENGLQASINGTRDVSVPVTFGVLTTVAAFMPIAFIEGVRGKIFAQITIVVVPILLFSLIETKFILPAHLKHLNLRRIGGQNRLTRWQQAFADGFERAILHYYHPVLNWVLKYRYACSAISFGVLLLLASMLMSGWMNFVFFPRVQSEVARASLTMPVGTPLEVTDRYVQRMTTVAQKLQQKYTEPDSDSSIIMNILSTTGTSGFRSSGSHVGRVMFEIRAPEDRQSSVTSRQLVNEWRKMIGQIPGAESLTFRAEIGRVHDPIDIEFRGNDFDQLSQVANQVKARIAGYPTVFDVGDSLSEGKESLEIILNDQAYSLGLKRSDITSQVRQAFYGLEVQRIQRGRDEIKVMVRYPRENRNSLDYLENLLITTPGGERVPLGEVVSLKPGQSPSTVVRIDRYRTVDVTADIDKTKTNMLVLQQEMSDFIDGLLIQYPGIRYSWEGEAKEQRQSFSSLQWGLIVVLFAIYCLLAIPFKSYIQPVIVMSVIPFGAIGAIGGHWLMSMDLTLVSLLGFLALTGIVVNDSLVLVDFINRHRAEYQDLRQAISKAGVARFRPIMLTSLTTFIGLMPLLFEKSTQAQFLIPMAVSLGFGVLFATFITLLIVPANYLIVEDFRELVRWAYCKLIGEEYSGKSK